MKVLGIFILMNCGGPRASWSPDFESSASLYLVFPNLCTNVTSRVWPLSLHDVYRVVRILWHNSLYTLPSEGQQQCFPYLNIYLKNKKLWALPAASLSTFTTSSLKAMASIFPPIHVWGLRTLVCQSSQQWAGQASENSNHRRHCFLSALRCTCQTGFLPPPPVPPCWQWPRLHFYSELLVYSRATAQVWVVVLPGCPCQVSAFLTCLWWSHLCVSHHN